MTTSVTFEAGTIADSMKKAARVAPSKVGSAFDKAAGIVIDLDPTGPAPVIVRATDTELFLLESLDSIKCEGTPARWRLPSMVLANVLGSLPATAGKTVTFTMDEKTPNQIVISSGRMRVRLNRIDSKYYPEWDPFDATGLTNAPNFGANITRIEWAASKAGPPPLNGIRLDGEHLITTDQYRIARVPCRLDLPAGPVTILAGGIGSLIKPMGDVLIGAAGYLFYVMPDDYTQITTTLIGGNYPNVEKVMGMPFEQEVKVSKNALIQLIQNAGNFAGSDRFPILTLFFGREELAGMMANSEVGLFGDVLELAGQMDHKRVQIKFTPKNILDALNNAPSDMITIKYNPSATNKPICIDDPAGYQVWIAPRGDKQPSST
jgi:DNA polymerase III sliding clamp (beta) subunit (PCNA family)